MTMRGLAGRVLVSAVIAGALFVGATRCATASQVFNPSNEHYYERVDVAAVPGVTWSDAKALAEALTAYGLPGYLATITSQSENDFIENNCGGWPALSSHWLGGYRAAADSSYSWDTGETMSYTNWYSPDSVDTTTNADMGVLFSWYDTRPDAAGKWMTTVQDAGGLVPGQPGYVVEYDANVTVGAVLDPDNGHYYERVQTDPGSPVTFQQAQAAAAAMTCNGWPGHLATVTSQAENDFIVNNLGGAGNCGRWLGGYNSGSGWTWVTGEAWQAGTTYTNWQSGSPNPSPSGAEGLIFDTTARTTPADLGTWSDVGSGTTLPGYVVEFEPVHRPTSLSLHTTTGRLGSAVTLSALLYSGGVPVVGRAVSFTVEGSPAGSGITDATGKATSPAYTIPYDLGEGFHSVTATFSGTGDSVYIGTTRTGKALNAVKIPTGMSLKPAAGEQGDTVQLTVLIMGGGECLSGKTISFAVDGTPAGSAPTDVNGVAGVSYLIPLDDTDGPHNVTCSFDGSTDPVYLSSARAGAALTVHPKKQTALSIYAASGTAGGTTTLAALLYAGGAPVPNKLVTFQVDGTGATVSGMTDANGKASATYNIPADMVAGSHDVTASFDGTTDPDYFSDTRTAPGALTVK